MHEEFPEQFMVTPKLPKKNIIPWNHYDRKSWIIGEFKPISLTDASMAKLMRAIIRCDVKIHDTHCLGKKIGTSELIHKPRFSSVVMSIALPVGSEKEFERLSGHKLSEPIQVQTNSSKNISDGFGNELGPCPKCGEKMTAVRPGKVQCDTTGCSNRG